jgi:hypothetical protein
MIDAYLGLGSNQNAESNMAAGIAELRARFGEVKVSPIYRSPAVGFSGEDFLNAAALIRTDLSVGDLKGLADRAGRPPRSRPQPAEVLRPLARHRHPALWRQGRPVRRPRTAARRSPEIRPRPQTPGRHRARPQAPRHRARPSPSTGPASKAIARCKPSNRKTCKPPKVEGCFGAFGVFGGFNSFPCFSCLPWVT